MHNHNAAKIVSCRSKRIRSDNTANQYGIRQAFDTSVGKAALEILVLTNEPDRNRIDLIESHDLDRRIPQLTRPRPQMNPCGSPGLRPTQ